MRELTMFIIEKCPHCAKAFKLIEEVKNENEKYRGIVINVIDENIQVELAASYDYYYVPAFFVGENKLHEGVINKEDVIRTFEAVL